MHSTSLKVTRAPLQILLSMCLLFDGWCFNILNLNRKRSERVFWHSQTCTRPRQEKIDATVHLSQSREGSGGLNLRPTMFARRILLPETISGVQVCSETFLLVLAILCELEFCLNATLLPRYHDLNRFPPVRDFSHTSKHKAFSPALPFPPPPGSAPPLGYPQCPNACCPRSRSPAWGGEVVPLTFQLQGQGPYCSQREAAAKDSLKALALQDSWNYSTRAGSQSFATALMGFCPFKFYKPVAFLMRSFIQSPKWPFHI